MESKQQNTSTDGEIFIIKTQVEINLFFLRKVAKENHDWTLWGKVGQVNILDQGQGNMNEGGKTPEIVLHCFVLLLRYAWWHVFYN